ncbi:MAG TPA: hypothetical protein VK421_09350 [Pyrinomonadaceae bacterium]|nr:hypothetical protein [Pyrinomonadaceae bacterium]
MDALPRRRALTIALTLSLPATHAFAQTAPPASPQGAAQKQAAPAPPPCDQARAVALVEQQAAEAKSFEPSAGKIRVLARAAGLLWPHRQEAARKLFADAFDIAAEHFRQRGDEVRREGRGLISRPPDQRFEVMREIAKHDPAWARKLAEGVADESKREGGKPDGPASSEPGAEGMRLGEKLIGLASALLEMNREAAVELARSSFRHPASYTHPQFLYELSKADREAADRLALEAAAAYSAAGETQDLSYLAAYAFGLKRAISPVSASTLYRVPEGFKPNPALQDALVKALLARAEMIIAAPERFRSDVVARAETTQITAALLTLETLAPQLGPALSERVTQARARVAATVSDLHRQYAENHLRWDQEDDGPQDFDAEYERAEAQANPARRDQAVAFLAMGTTDLEQLARLERLAEKASDANVRRQLLDWIGFTRAQQLARAGQFDEARGAADRIGELDLRAVLYFEIARESVKRLEDKTRAGELLAAVAAAARSAPNTAIKARAQLGVSHLFADFDALRSLEVLAEAVKTVNVLEGDTDIARPFVQRRIEGKDFSSYGSFNVPGFSLENAFREAGARDFDGALLTARNLTDRVLRATAVMGLASRCLEQPAPAPRQPRQPKKPADKGLAEGRAKP